MKPQKIEQPKIEYVTVVSDDERWFERDVYVNGVFVQTQRFWKRIIGELPVNGRES